MCLILQLLMKDVAAPMDPTGVRAVLAKCLRKAADKNYEALCNEAQIEREIYRKGFLHKIMHATLP